MYYHGYDKLRSLKVPEIHKPMKEGEIIQQELKGHLKQKTSVRYETTFMWKSNKNLLRVNKIAGLRALQKQQLKDPS